MALLSFRGISTPSLPAQGEQRRSSYFNIPRGNSIIVSIDQYAEAALGNREYFLNKPHGIGGGRNDHIP